MVAGTFQSEENLLDKQMKVHIFSNDPNAEDILIPVNMLVFTENTSYIYSENHENYEL